MVKAAAIAVSLFCATALWRQSAIAETEPPPKEVCLSVLWASNRAYITQAARMTVEVRSAEGLTELEAEHFRNVRFGIDLVVAMSGCSMGVWGDYKKCVEAAMKVTDIASDSGYRMIAQDCYRKISDVYGQ